MSLSTYSDLKTAVQNFLRRSDLSTVIPDFISLAEVRINGDLDARKQDTLQSVYTTAGVQSITLPDDLINIRSARLISAQDVVLDYLAPDQFSTAYPSSYSALPQAFTIIGSKMHLAPVPDSAYEIRLLYKQKVPSLAANETTWLMTTYPHVYLYATLCEAAPYIKDDSRIQIWENKYNESIDTVNAQDWYSGSTMRVRTDVRP